MFSECSVLCNNWSLDEEHEWFFGEGEGDEFDGQSDVADGDGETGNTKDFDVCDNFKFELHDKSILMMEKD